MSARGASAIPPLHSACRNGNSGIALRGTLDRRRAHDSYLPDARERRCQKWWSTCAAQVAWWTAGRLCCCSCACMHTRRILPQFAVRLPLCCVAQLQLAQAADVLKSALGCSHRLRRSQVASRRFAAAVLEPSRYECVCYTWPIICETDSLLLFWPAGWLAVEESWGCSSSFLTRCY